MKKKKLVYNDLINFNKKNFFNILLEEDIVNIFKLNPNLIFFTDKINDFEKLNYLLKKINNKTYVEVYSLKDYLSAKRYGLKNIIYSSDLSNFDMFIINLFNINNVSVSKNFIDEKKKINFILNPKHNITFFCYTVNDYDFIKKYKKNIKYFFTDFLLPNELLSLK